MKRVLSVLSVIALFITMCAVITVPTVAAKASNVDALVNLFDTSTAQIVPSATNYYETVAIPVTAGDVLYLSPCYTGQTSYQFRLYKEDGTVTKVTNSNLTQSETIKIGTLTKPFYTTSYTIPEGYTSVTVACHKSVVNQYLLTKNQPFSNADRIDYFDISFTSLYSVYDSGLWKSDGTDVGTTSKTTYKSANKITVENGDKIYFGPCRTKQDGYLYHWETVGTSVPIVSAASAQLQIADIFDNGDVLYCYTAPKAGELGIVCYKTYFDSFVITKNEPVTAENFFDYWEGQDSTMDLSGYSAAPTLTANAFKSITETPGYYLEDGTFYDSSKYYSGELISVAAGDVVYFGPYSSASAQDYFLIDWHGKSGYSDYTKLTKSMVANSTQSYIAETFPNGQVILAYQVTESGRVGIISRSTYTKMFFATKNVRITAENFYDYWDLHSNVCGDYSETLGRFNNVVPQESVLNGKTALFVGDSLCAASADDNFYNSFNGMDVAGWAGRIAMNYGLKKAVNSGVSGSAFSTTRDRWYNTTTTSKKQGRIYWQIASETTNKYDYVVIEGGGNDAWDSVEVGTISEGFEWENFDLSTYAGGLEAAIYQAVTYHPEAAIGYMSVFQMPYCTKGRLGDAREYFEMGEKICEKWGIPYLDLFNTLTAENFDTSIYTHDTVHAVSAGYNIMAPYIGEWMETLKPYSEIKKDHEKTVIACVGDSLTKGEKGGDVTRYSYPAYLQEMLGEENYEVLNYGWGGATAQVGTSNPYKATRQYKDSVQYDPDQVIILLGANDAKEANWDTADHAGSCAKFIADLKALVTEYQNLPSKPTVYLATPAYATGAFRSTVYNEGGMLAAIKALGAEMNVRVIDTYAPTDGKADLLVDGAHYTAEGYELIAATIYEGITDKTAPDVLPITEKNTAVAETNEAKPLIRNWKAYYETANAFRIETVEDVRIFGDLIAAGYTFAGKTVYLENDLDFTGVRFKPLGATSGKSETQDYNRAFQGVFDGQKHVFSNVCITEYRYPAIGLFPALYKATVKNFGLDGGRIEGHTVVGGITAYGDGGTQLINVWSSADVYATTGAAGIAANMRKNDGENPKMINVACYGMVSGKSTLYGICAWGQKSALLTENVVFGGIIDLHTKTNTSSPFVYYDNENPITDVAVGYYTTEEAEMKTVHVSDVEPVRFAAKAFRNGEFAAYINKQTESPVWTMKYGYAVPFADENNAAPIAVTKDSVTYYTDYAGDPIGFSLEDGAYWYLNGTLTALNDMPAQFKDGDVLGVAVSKAGADFDNSGSITTADAIMLLRYLDGHKNTGLDDTLADVNADGKARIFDAVRLLQVIRDLPVA